MLLGSPLGAPDGSPLGRPLGTLVGILLGSPLGMLLGSPLGMLLGSPLGILDGSSGGRTAWTCVWRNNIIVTSIQQVKGFIVSMHTITQYDILYV